MQNTGNKENKVNTLNKEKLNVNTSNYEIKIDAAEVGEAYAKLSNFNLEQRYDQILNSEASQEMDMQILAARMFDLYGEAFDKWHSEKHELLEGKDLAEYLASLSNQDLLNFTFAFVKKSDFDLPKQLEESLGKISPEYKDKVLQELLGTSIERRDFSNIDEEIALRYGTARLLQVLAEWKNPEYTKSILNWFLKSENPDERLQDDVVAYFEKTSDHSFNLIKDALMNELDSKKTNANKENNSIIDILILAVTKIGKNNAEQKNETYKVLRKAFKEMKDKTLIVMSLGDLGSARAIPLLRSYIEDNYENMPEELYADFYVAIKKLGGNTDDLPTVSKQLWNWEF